MLFTAPVVAQTCVVTGDSIAYERSGKELGTYYIEHHIVIAFNKEKDSINGFTFVVEGLTTGVCIVSWAHELRTGIEVYMCRDEDDTPYIISIDSVKDALRVYDFNTDEAITFKHPVSVMWYE